MTLQLALEQAGFRLGANEHFQLAAIDSLRAIDCATFPVDQPDRAQPWIEKRNGRAALYLCLNPVPADAGAHKVSAAQVTTSRTLLADFDPEKSPDDPAGLDPHKRALAEGAARKALALFPSCGVLVFSGRGTQLWLHHEPDVDRKSVLDFLRYRLDLEGVKLDGTHNPDRLARLPGTINPRTGLDATLLLPWGGKLVRAIDVPPVPKPEAHEVAPADFGAPAQEDLALLAGCDAAQALWREPTQDRSKRDAQFVLALFKSRVPDAAACRLLYALPGGKANEDRRGESYWLSTASWARAQLVVEERHRKVLADLPTELVKNPSHAFSREVLSLACWLREESDFGGYAVLKHHLRLQKVNLTDFEHARKDQAAALTGSTEPPDDYLRQAVQDTISGQRSLGWWLRTVTCGWVQNSLSEIRLTKVPPAQLQAAVDRPWIVVNEPFQPLELPGRRWNRTRARLRVLPSPGTHPTWDQILTVIGRGLDDAVALDPWCLAHGIHTGADYLRTWLASLFQRPGVPLPYLFLHGPENTGKSLFWEAIAEALLTGGCVRADQALQSEGGFNAELAQAVLAVVEEVDLGKSRGRAYCRIKDWVTGATIKVHEKGRTPYDLPNTTHWVQCANRADHCPVFDGDTRITSIYVVGANGHERRPKNELRALLCAEAGALLHTLLGIDLPRVSDGRLGVPAIATVDKLLQAEANRSELEGWLARTPRWVLMDDETLVRAVHLELSERWWTPSRILSELPREGAVARRLWLQLRGQPGWEGSGSDAARVVGSGLSPVSAGRALQVLAAIQQSPVQTTTRRKYRVRTSDG